MHEPSSICTDLCLSAFARIKLKGVGRSLTTSHPIHEGLRKFPESNHETKSGWLECLFIILFDFSLLDFLHFLCARYCSSVSSSTSSVAFEQFMVCMMICGWNSLPAEHTFQGNVRRLNRLSIYSRQKSNIIRVGGKKQKTPLLEEEIAFGTTLPILLPINYSSCVRQPLNAPALVYCTHHLGTCLW